MQNLVIGGDEQVVKKKNSSIAVNSSKLVGKATTDKGIVRRIRVSRPGCFSWLPVYCENDMVHGSWWMVWGSLVSAIIPCIPLADLHLHFFVIPEETQIRGFDFDVTWIMLILMGIFFTIGIK